MKEILWSVFLIIKKLKLFKHLTSVCIDHPLNIDNPYFEGMVGRIYPPELQLNKANVSDTEAPFLDSLINFKRICLIQNYDKLDEFDFDSKFPLQALQFSAYSIC